MHSSPEYIAMWLGLAKAGIVTALVNNNLKLDTLAHSVNVVNSKAIIFDYDHREAIAEVMPLLKDKKIKYFMFGDGEAPRGSSAILKDLSTEPKKFDLVPVNFSDKLVYVYTSGTTGYPKAVIMKQSRYITAGVGVKSIMRMTEDDIIYTALPLHHFAGGIMGSSQAVLQGSTMAIRSKASVSNYWEDCKKFNATIGQYVGEVCCFSLDFSHIPCTISCLILSIALSLPLCST
jgi:solute carrier family 27 fatty acid transporter 1/4